MSEITTNGQDTAHRDVPIEPLVVEVEDVPESSRRRHGTLRTMVRGAVVVMLAIGAREGFSALVNTAARPSLDGQGKTEVPMPSATTVASIPIAPDVNLGQSR